MDFWVVMFPTCLFCRRLTLIRGGEYFRIYTKSDPPSFGTLNALSRIYGVQCPRVANSVNYTK